MIRGKRLPLEENISSPEGGRCPSGEELSAKQTDEVSITGTVL